MAHPILTLLALISVALVGAGLWLRAAPDREQAAVEPAPAALIAPAPEEDAPAPVIAPPPPADEPPAAETAQAPAEAPPPASAQTPYRYDLLPPLDPDALLPPPPVAASPPAEDDSAAAARPFPADGVPGVLLTVPPGGGQMLTPEGERLFDGPEEIIAAPPDQTATDPMPPAQTPRDKLDEKDIAALLPPPATVATPDTGTPQTDAIFAPVTYGPATRLHPVPPDTMTVMQRATFDQAVRSLHAAPYFGAVAFDGPRAVVGAGGYASLEAAEAAVLARCRELVSDCRIGARYLPERFDDRRTGTLSHHQAEVWERFLTEPMQTSSIIDFHRTFAWSDDGAALVFDMIGEDAARSMALLRCNVARREVNRPAVPGSPGCQIGAIRAD